MLVKIGFKAEGDEKLKGVEDRLDAIKHRLEFLGAIEIAKGIFELTERFAHFAEEIHIAALSAGLTAEAFQKLAFAAGHSGVSQDEMSASMARLSRHLYDAKRGGAEAAKVFADAGFKPGQIQGFKTGSDVMLALSDRFKNIQDPIKKQAIAMELMGRGSINMVGFLSQGSGAIGALGDKAEKLGIIMSSETVESLVKVEHALREVYDIFKSVGIFVASIFSPEITYLIDEFEKFWMANNKVVKSGLEEWIKKILYGIGFLWGAVEGITKIIYKFGKSHEGVVKLALSFLMMAGYVIGISAAIGKLVSIWESLNGAIGIFNALLFANPLTPWILGITAMVVAVHDLWEALHGRKGWMEQFVEWLGILEPIESVLNSIGEIINDIIDSISHLDFGKLFKDVSSDVKAIGGWFTKGFGSEEGQDKVQNAVTNLTELPGRVAAAPGAIGGSSSSVQDNSNTTYQVNAPITINAPAGVDHKQIAKSVQDGVRQHLDRVQRETSRSLRPTESY
jgi:hypothetical protein